MKTPFYRVGPLLCLKAGIIGYFINSTGPKFKLQCINSSVVKENTGYGKAFKTN